MYKLLIVFLLLASGIVSADVLVGGGSLIVQYQTNTLHRYSDLLLVETRKGDYSITGAILHKFTNRVKYAKPLKYQPMIMVHKKYGKRFYFKPGIGLVRATKWNSALNFCPALGVSLFGLDTELIHCSNAGLLDDYNSGFNFVTLKWVL